MRLCATWIGYPRINDGNCYFSENRRRGTISGEGAMSEQYIYSDLGYQERGTRVQATLSGNAANVFLVDSSNYSNYRAGRNFRYTGGLANSSPVVLVVPSSGHWYAIADLRGLAGQIKGGFRVLPKPLPSLRQSPLPSLTSIREGLEHMSGNDESKPVARDWDVFISHATEDKDDIVRPLAVALQAVGLSVWYDEFELRIGDSLRRKIDAGLTRSRFGVVILSPAFFEKNWPQYELDGLVTREMEGTQVILPLWHKITKAQLMAHSPSLADKVARTTANSTIEEIAQEIRQVVNDPR